METTKTEYRVTIDAELIHNYSQRYINLPYFQKLKFDHPAAEKALRQAHYAHHKTGLNAHTAAQELATRYPAIFDVR